VRRFLAYQIWLFFLQNKNLSEVFVVAKELLYLIPAAKCDKKEIIHILKSHPEIKFVSMVGIDLAGNDTDEKIPVRGFL